MSYKGGDAIRRNLKKDDSFTMEYFLLDLERTLLSGVPAYWKGNKHGYTYDIKDAGKFQEQAATLIVESDRDTATVKVPMKLVLKVLGEDFKINETD